MGLKNHFEITLLNPKLNVIIIVKAARKGNLEPIFAVQAIVPAISTREIWVNRYNSPIFGWLKTWKVEIFKAPKGIEITAESIDSSLAENTRICKISTDRIANLTDFIDLRDK